MSPQLALARAESPATLDALRETIPDFAKDIRLNLGTILTPEGAPDLTPEQIAGIGLACAYATKHPHIAVAVESYTQQHATPEITHAAKAAASLMAMNNVYYRFVHLSGDDELRKLPAKLRMTFIGNPGIPKADFELMCLAVSAVNGCGMCIEAHNHELLKIGVSRLGIQSAARIAAVLNATSQALHI